MQSVSSRKFNIFTPADLATAAPLTGLVLARGFMGTDILRNHDDITGKLHNISIDREQSRVT